METRISMSTCGALIWILTSGLGVEMIKRRGFDIQSTNCMDGTICIGTTVGNAWPIWVESRAASYSWKFSTSAMRHTGSLDLRGARFVVTTEFSNVGLELPGLLAGVSALIDPVRTRGAGVKCDAGLSQIMDVLVVVLLRGDLTYCSSRPRATRSRTFAKKTCLMSMCVNGLLL